MAKRQSRQQPSSLKFRIGPLLAMEISPQEIVKLIFTELVTSSEIIVGKQVVRAMERSEAGTSVFKAGQCTSRCLSSTPEPQSLQTLRTLLSQSSSFPLSCLVHFLKTLITVILC